MTVVPKKWGHRLDYICTVNHELVTKYQHAFTDDYLLPKPQSHALARPSLTDFTRLSLCNDPTNSKAPKTLSIIDAGPLAFKWSGNRYLGYQYHPERRNTPSVETLILPKSMVLGSRISQTTYA